MHAREKQQKRSPLPADRQAPSSAGGRIRLWRKLPPIKGGRVFNFKFVSGCKKTAISILSGGLDSTVATALARRTYKIELAITFDYGQRAARREIEASKVLCKKFGIRHRVISLPWLCEATKTALVDRKRKIPQAPKGALENNSLARARSVWVPNRNGAFIAIAAAIAESGGAPAIITGFNADEARAFPDNSVDFIDASNRALSFSTLNKVKIVSPTAKMTKREIFKKLLSLGLNYNSIWFCYEGGRRPCGRCESCARTIRAMNSL